MSVTCDVGDAAPAFDLEAGGGRRITLNDFRGKKLVLYFYPKDDTSGCTAEAIDFSALKGEFAKAGAALLGVSPDSVKSHDKFRAKHDLTHELAADPDKSVVSAYGVWVEKSMYGRKYMGVERSTFLIDGEGRIAHVWRKVKVAGHAQDALTAVRALGPGKRAK
jgi:peroxiredoxin Q/BCP